MEPKWGVIGCGNIAQHSTSRHSRRPGQRSSTVADLRPDVARTCGESCGARLLDRLRSRCSAIPR